MLSTCYAVAFLLLFAMYIHIKLCLVYWLVFCMKGNFTLQIKLYVNTICLHFLIHVTWNHKIFVAIYSRTLSEEKIEGQRRFRWKVFLKWAITYKLTWFTWKLVSDPNPHICQISVYFFSKKKILTKTMLQVKEN